MVNHSQIQEFSKLNLKFLSLLELHHVFNAVGRIERMSQWQHSSQYSHISLDVTFKLKSVREYLFLNWHRLDGWL